MGAEIVLLNDPLLSYSGRGRGDNGVAHPGKEQRGAFLQCLSQSPDSLLAAFQRWLP